MAEIESVAEDLTSTVSLETEAEVEPQASTTQPDAPPVSRRPCWFGARCYRKNEQHRHDFSHPGDADYEELGGADAEAEEGASADDRPVCRYGQACYRKNPQHRLEFQHPTPRKRPRRNRRESERESDADDDYDLDDSFIDDDGGEEEQDSDQDSDYEPEKDLGRLDADLLRDEQWKAEPDDAPEVLELLSEARDYLRNKKLHK